jgi:GTP pyrophosphokinase
MLSERFDAALLFASALHRRQVRKATGLPYVSHLLAVASLTIEDRGSEDEAIAALLHDSIEDWGDVFEGGRAGLRAHIENQFGPAVLAIVNACTDDDEIAKGQGADPIEERKAWRRRKQLYVDRISSMSLAALRVSCADKLHNVRSTLSDYELIGEELWSRFRTGRGEDQLWYCRALADAFARTPLKRLSAMLGREVSALEECVARRRGESLPHHPRTTVCDPA